MRPFGAWINRGSDNGAYGFGSSTAGLMFGGDSSLGDRLRLGGSFAWGSSSIRSDGGTVAPQSQGSSLYEFIGYGSYALAPQLELNTQVSGGYGVNNSTRGIRFMGETAKGSYTSGNFHFATALQRQFDVVEGTSLIPSARLDYTWISNAGYSETGANVLNLNVAQQTYNAALIGADGKIRQELFNDENHLIANLGVSYYMTPTATNVLASYQGTPTLQFVTTGLVPSHVMGYAGAGYEYRVTEDIEVVGRYDVAFQSNYANQMASLKARWSF
jgi:uncharacterized protein with beta-barrel porin domain